MPLNHTPFYSNEKVDYPIEATSGVSEFRITKPRYTFSDVILPEKIVDEIKCTIALEQYHTLIYDVWDLGSVLKYKRCLSINLYGRSGTGKTMTAHAIAASLGKRVLQVDYSEIESKYVGETSKNLVAMFETARIRDAVILFDEADALLSKRVTAMHSATDVSVNQTRNVLLWLLDQYQGVVIFTTNFIRNFDKAFMRRILSHIAFDDPDFDTRLRLWDYYLVSGLPLASDRQAMIKQLAQKQSNGSDISNAVLKSSIRIAMGHGIGLDVELLSKELDQILDSRNVIREEKGKDERDVNLKNDDGKEEVTITSKKVSEEYVLEKAEKGEIIHGLA